MMKRNYILFCLLMFYTFAFSQAEMNYTDIKDCILKEDNLDLQFLDKTIKGVQVLALGEATHGTREFNLMYLKMFKYLVEEHNFTTLFLEDEYSRCLLLDNYIKCQENCDTVSVRVLRNFPWITEEMNALIGWMRDYNRSNDQKRLSIVGIDVQDSKHIFLALNQILRSSQQDTVTSSSISYASPLDAQTERKYAKRIKKYAAPELVELFKGKANRVEEQSRNIYAQLVDNLEWSRLENKHSNRNVRDLAMGKNILAYLSKFPKSRGMLIAHNGHIANINDGKKNELKRIAYIGGVVREVIGKKYFSIMQEFDKGCFNAYAILPENKNGLSEKKSKYELTKVCIEKSVDASIGAILRACQGDIVYISESDLFDSTDLDQIKFHHIGGMFLAEKKNPNQTRQYFNLTRENWFDAVIFHKQSTPTTLLEK